MEVRQRATAMYLIDVFALRAGNEKGEEEADTVGCCSLRFEHVTLEPPDHVIFDFLGKDSIRFYNKVKVDAQVFKNLKIFKREPKGPGDKLFDRVQVTLPMFVFLDLTNFIRRPISTSIYNHICLALVRKFSVHTMPLGLWGKSLQS